MLLLLLLEAVMGRRGKEQNEGIGSTSKASSSHLICVAVTLLQHQHQLWPTLQPSSILHFGDMYPIQSDAIRSKEQDFPRFSCLAYAVLYDTLRFCIDGHLQTVPSVDRYANCNVNSVSISISISIQFQFDVYFTSLSISNLI